MLVMTEQTTEKRTTKKKQTSISETGFATKAIHAAQFPESNNGSNFPSDLPDNNLRPAGGRSQ